MKLRYSLGAAAAVALMMAVSGCGNPTDAKSDAAGSERRIPAAPAGQTMSPGAVTQQLQGRGFTPTNVRRRGSDYVVDAAGPSGNLVRLVIDGRHGVVRGMDVIQWAPGRSRIARGSRGNRFVNDSYEYGFTVSDAMLVDWIVYEESEWVTETAWIEYEEVSESFSWEEVTYEESIEEVSYEAYEETYGSIETYEESFYEETSWSEEYGETEFSYEDEEAYTADLSESYGEEYASEYAEEEFSEEYSEEDQAMMEESSEEDMSAEEEAYDDSGDQADDGSYDDGGDAGADDGGDDGSYDDGGGDDGGGDDGGGDYGGEE